MNPWIGRFSVKGVKADSKDDFMICKLKARLNLHGILNVEQGYYVEDVEVEEPIPEDKDAEKKDGDVSVTIPSRPVPVRTSREDEPTTKRPRLEETELTPVQAMDTDEKPKTRKVK